MLPPTPKTQGIKYAGSKLRLLPQIIEMVHPLGVKSIFDGFSGTTRVSQAFAQLGYKVIANDISEWSRVFGLCYLKNSLPATHYQPILDHLNSLGGTDGWFTEHYGGSPNNDTPCVRAKNSSTTKKPWQIHNTRKLDAIRDEIDRLHLSETERAVLLTSLILALDRVDSTLGHFASYLNGWSARSYKTMHLEVPSLLALEDTRNAEHTVHKGDIFDTIPNITADLAYFDPPYGSNNEKMPPSRVRYAAYYHLWTSICLNDRPEIFGKVARRKDTSDTQAASIFEDFRKNEEGTFLALDALAKLLQSVEAKYVMLSYSSGGRATAEEIAHLVRSTGKLLAVREINYRRNIMAQMCWTNEWKPEEEKKNIEYLFLMRK